MTAALFLFSAAFLGLGVFVLLSEYQVRSGSVRVLGRVVGYTHSKRNSPKTSSYFSVANFQHSDGHSYFVVSNSGSTVPLEKIGDSIPVCVKPGDPISAAIPSPMTIVFGTALVIIGIGIFSYMVFTFFLDIFSLAFLTFFLAASISVLSKTFRKVPLSREEWKKLKKKTNLAGQVFRDDEADQILWATYQQPDLNRRD